MRRFVDISSALLRTVLAVCLVLTASLGMAQSMGDGTSLKSNRVKAVIRGWQMRNDYGIADTIRVDTAEVNYPMRDVLNDHSIAWAYNGNLISPLQSKIWFDRSGNGMLGTTGTGGDIWTGGGLGLPTGVRKKINFLFADAYQPYILTAQDVTFYRTTIAYSDIAYKKGFTTYHSENDLSFHFTGNINKRTNLGMQLSYLNSPGHYTSQEGKVFSGAVFGSYDGDNYGLHAAVVFNTLSNFENGGLQDVSQLGGSLNPEDMPVNMTAMSGFRHISGLLDHHYSITVDRERKMKIRGRHGAPDRDSVWVEHVPVTTFNHVFEVNNSTRRYIEQNASQGFFPETCFNTRTTSDTAAVLNIRNTLAVTINEEFNHILHFGATAYATNECQRYQYTCGQRDTLVPAGFWQNYDAVMQYTAHRMPDSLVANHWTNNTWVGGSIYKNHGKWVKFNVNGDVCLAGYKLGEFQVNGHVDGDWKVGRDTMYVRAAAYVKNETPDWYLQQYRSNHFIWNNAFGKTYRFYVGGAFSYPSTWFKVRLRAGFENITRYIYFNREGYPVQHSGNIQVISADGRFDLTTPWINLENTVVWQMASDSVLPLPMLSLYHNLYYHGWWARRAMYAQIGVDLRYHTAYYAPVLNPATGQFCIQDDVKIGNYPVMNLYASFYVKLLHLRFFAQWQHFNYYFMKHKTYLSMPDYAMNPAVIRAGLAWHFWR